MPSICVCTEMQAIHVLYELRCFNRDLALQWTFECSSFNGTEDDRRPRLTA